jgi:hypothetical protein
MSIDFSKVFIFVIASFDIPEYREFIRYRKLLFKKYNIPHMFLYETQPPLEYKLDEYDKVFDIDLNEECISTIKDFCPKMILKFLKGLQCIDYEKYDYIVRINLSTYIQFPKFLEMLNTLPKEKLFAGFVLKIPLPDFILDCIDSEPFITGICMIFSKDVIEYLSNIPADSSVLYQYYDDVIISYIVKKYTQMICLRRYCEYIDDELKTIDINAIKELERPIIRIKHDDDRTKDLVVWKKLLSLENLF